MRAQTKSAMYQCLLLLVLTGCILTYCLLVHGPSDRTVMTRIFVGIASISLIFCAVVLYSRARLLRSQSSTAQVPVYLVTGRLMGGKLEEHHRPLPVCTDFFWVEGKILDDHDEKNICSICLGEVVLCEEKHTVGKSVCCGSLFHKPCTQQYWESIAEVRCPNCRFEP